MPKLHLQNAPGRSPAPLLPPLPHPKHPLQARQRRRRRNPRCKSRRSLIGTLSSRIEFLPLSDLTRRLKKECKSDGLKFQGSPKTIKIDEVWEQSEFEAIFSGQGTLIQPTPNNKPKSTVTIIHFVCFPSQSPHTSHLDHFFCRKQKPKLKNSSVMN